MNLIKLAERVEAASGPDRELDAEIAPLQGLRRVDEGHPIGRVWYNHRGHGVPLPSFTGSLDAAMQLVPEGDDVSGESFRLEAYNKSGVLADHVRASAWVPGAPRVFAATPALALCAAALRARATQQ